MKSKFNIQRTDDHLSIPDYDLETYAIHIGVEENVAEALAQYSKCFNDVDDEFELCGDGDCQFEIKKKFKTDVQVYTIESRAAAESGALDANKKAIESFEMITRKKYSCAPPCRLAIVVDRDSYIGIGTRISCGDPNDANNDGSRTAYCYSIKGDYTATISCVKTV